MVLKRVKILLILFFIYCCIYESFSQVRHSKLDVGLSYGIGNEFTNKDYSYSNRYIKGQLYYSLKKTKNFEFQIVLAPEINFATHQLLNFYFVKPEEPNFQELRDRYTQLKDIREYILHVGFLVRKPLSKQLSVYIVGSVGPMITDTQTERLSKGFAFSDVFGVGISYKVKDITFDFRPNLRHNSNAGLQNSNAGFNTLNYEFGVVLGL